MKQWLIDLMKNFMGPGILFAVLALGWWAYNDNALKQANIVLLEESVQQLSLTLSGQCEQLLESQGFTVEKIEVPEE